jgi:hypothetical protein
MGLESKHDLNKKKNIKVSTYWNKSFNILRLIKNDIYSYKVIFDLKRKFLFHIWRTFCKNVNRLVL